MSHNCPSQDISQEEAEVFKKFANRMFQLMQVSFPDRPAFIPLEYHENDHPELTNQIIFQRVPKQKSEEASQDVPVSFQEDAPRVE